MMTHMTMGAALNYMFTGEAPRELKDYFFPRTGGTDEAGRPSRFSIPDYVKDIYHFGEEPLKTVMNKVHPTLTTLYEMYKNKDFYGTQIRNEDDPIVQQLKDVALHGVKTLEPFTSRNIRQSLARGEAPISAAKSIIGLTPAPSTVSKSDFERSLSELAAEQMPVGGRTKEAAAKSDLKRLVSRALTKGDSGPIGEAVSSGKITLEDAKQIVKENQMSPLVRSLHRADLKAVVTRLHLATDEERTTTAPILLMRLVEYVKSGSHTAPEKQDMIALYKKAGVIQ
jgi:hypothetical protein